jgi:hypothetical protein
MRMGYCIKCKKSFWHHDLSNEKICPKCHQLRVHEGDFIEVFQGTYVLALGRTKEQIIKDMEDKGYKDVQGASASFGKITIEQANTISNANNFRK